MALRMIEEHALGLTWVIEEPMARASHALVDQGRVWLIDPVDDGGAIDRAAALGTPAGVLQLLDRHGRDCEAVAGRLGVDLHVVPRELPHTPFEVLELVDNRLWREVALWWPQHNALVIPEAVGTSRMFTGDHGHVGVHIGLRLTPPRKLAGYAPEHLLVGHGPPLHGQDTGTELRSAVDHSRRDLPRLLVKLPSALRS
ncbi:MAG: hypothetical protein JWP17_1510 [Solirubrobacterales bacterium]|jgi:hypothetical protein|nr:hypothetical protein [Solirubrobacterales bacterium]